MPARPIPALTTAAAVTVAAPLALGFTVSARAGTATLTILGGMLAGLALLWGATSLRREYRTLRRDLGKLHDITHSDLGPTEQDRQREAVRPPSSTGLDVLYFRETVRLYVLQQAYDNLGAPAGLALLGLSASTVGSVWSLWL